MRLVTYLNESTSKEEIVKLINRDCKPFLSEFDFPLYRGIRSNQYFMKKEVRKDRRPLMTDTDWSNEWDDAFEKVFKWRPRSQGMFTTTSPAVADIYGTIYSVFPIGKYEYIYSLDIMDLAGDEIPPKNERTQFIKKHYKSSGLNSYRYTGSEIMFKCDSYYAVMTSMDDEEIYKELGLHET